MRIKYGDKVKIIDGFYKDCIGTAIAYNDKEKEYTVEIVKDINGKSKVRKEVSVPIFDVLLYNEIKRNK